MGRESQGLDLAAAVGNGAGDRSRCGAPARGTRMAQANGMAAANSASGAIVRERVQERPLGWRGDLGGELKLIPSRKPDQAHGERRGELVAALNELARACCVATRTSGCSAAARKRRRRMAWRCPPSLKGCEVETVTDSPGMSAYPAVWRANDGRVSDGDPVAGALAAVGLAGQGPRHRMGLEARVMNTILIGSGVTRSPGSGAANWEARDGRTIYKDAERPPAPPGM